MGSTSGFLINNSVKSLSIIFSVILFLGCPGDKEEEDSVDFGLWVEPEKPFICEKDTWGRLECPDIEPPKREHD